MSIQQITSSQTGLVGVYPRVIYISTDDTEDAILITGYLNQQVQSGQSIRDGDMALVITKTSPSAVDVSSGWYQVEYVAPNWSLISISSPGDVTLPTITNHIAVYTNVTGTLSDDAITAINGGNIQAGLSGTAGYLASFPSTASRGSLVLQAVANTGNTLTTISNVAMGQASVISIPDPANALGRFLVGATATPFVAGNFPINSGTGGLMVDSGIPVADILTTTDAVLLTPAGNQTITAHNLALSAGTFTSSGSITSTSGPITSGGLVTGTTGLQAGLPAGGNPGSLVLYTLITGQGSLRMLTTGNAGNFSTTITDDATLGQSQAITIPDVIAATGQFLVKTAAFVNGNLVQASGTVGLCVDSGIATTNVQLKTQVKAATTGNVGGTGAGPLSILVADLTTASVVVASVESSSNAVSVVACTATATGFDVTLSADPGASCFINYIAYIVAQ